MASTAIKVLIVDDSAVIRKILTDILSSDPAIEVVGTAMDPYVAREKIKKLQPDVITLDIEMPKMDGISFLKNIMRLRPMPVIMISTLTQAGADVTLTALELGAVDFVSKPQSSDDGNLENYSAEIINKVKIASIARVRSLSSRKKRPAQPEKLIEEKRTADAVIAKESTNRRFKSTHKIIAVGASTGGTEAIRQLLDDLDEDSPGIVLAQHIPIAFSMAFANRCNTSSLLNVSQARDGQQILRGHAYIAPGDMHLLIARSGDRYFCKLSSGPLVNRHKPSVDVLFRSVAQVAGPNAIGVILTGMGNDGAQGLLELKEAKAPTIAQDEQSSVVWGMPGAAVKMGAADVVVRLDDIASSIISNY